MSEKLLSEWLAAPSLVIPPTESTKSEGGSIGSTHAVRPLDS